MIKKKEKIRLKSKISKYKKRLDVLKKQGFYFSNNIYEDLNLIEKKIKQPTNFHYFWKYKLTLYTKIALISSILLITLIGIWFWPPIDCKLIIDNLDDDSIIVISDKYIFNGTATCFKGDISKVQVQINNSKWYTLDKINPWSFTVNAYSLPNGNHTLTFRYSIGKDFHYYKEKIPFIVKKPPPQFVLTVDNLDNETILNDDFIINGTASCSFGDISFVQIKIDETNIFYEKNETNPWSYNLNVSNLSIGKVNISFLCSDGIHFSKEKKFIITIVEKLPENISIIINSPEYYEGVQDTVKVKGTISGEPFEIQNVEIRFDDNEWLVAKGISPWYYYWNTNKVGDGICNISVRVKLFDNTYSAIHSTAVYVYNDIDDPFEIKFPQEFIDNYGEMIPNEKYRLYGYHKKQSSSYDQITELNVDGNEDWVKITFEEKTIVTPANGEIYRVIYHIELTNEAPKDSQDSFSIVARTYPDMIIILPNKIQILTDDIWVYTGSW